MKQKLLSLLALGALIMGATACKDGDKWGTVDGKTPETELQATHIRTEVGHSIQILGTLKDADGIKTVQLLCPDLYLKKTIDLIEIYGEPQKEYKLDYTYKIERYKKGEEYNIEVIVTDVCGNNDTKNVKVTLDGDYSAPVFVAAPSAETTVLMQEGAETIFELEFTVTDNRGIDYVVASINKYDLATKEIGESVDPEHFPMTVKVFGEDTYEYSEAVILPSEAGCYLVRVEAYDMPAQNGEVRSAEATGVVTVLGGVNFSKMYLADVATAAELNADVFGVPMRIDKVGDCQYRARYYNEKANTEIYFIPQKGALSPICYGVDPNDPSKLINSPGNVLPLVLPNQNTYYEINFNTETGDYEYHSYEVADYMDPIFWDQHSENLNYWWSWVDTGKDDWVPTDDAWMRDFYIGYATGPADVIGFVRDPNNKHRYYLENPLALSAGEDMHFIIHNWHGDGWWNFVSWRVDDSQECDIFYYYGNAIKQAYLDWYFGEGVAEWKKWADNEDYRKQLIYGGGSDNWCAPHVNQAGNYQLYFDAHLGRAKLVPAK